MEFFTVELPQGHTLTIKELTLSQISGIGLTPRFPEPEPSDEWKASGMPKEQSPEWLVARGEWLSRMSHEELLRRLGMSFALATMDGHNTALVKMLTDEGVPDYIAAMKKPLTPEDQLNASGMLFDAAKFLDFLDSVYTDTDQDHTHLPLARCERWLIYTAGLIDSAAVTAWRKSIWPDSERPANRGSGKKDKRKPKSTKDQGNASVGKRGRNGGTGRGRRAALAAVE
jgi:hypothetical protein